MKLKEAVKNLAAVIKLHDTVLQSLGQVRRLEIVEENDGVRGGVEGLEAYYHATRYVSAFGFISFLVYTSS